MNKKLLIAEDDPFLARVYSAKIKGPTIETIMLENGEQVYEIAKREKPDVIALDVIMPVKDGFAVLKELMGDEETKNIPVIVLTALASKEDKTKIMDLGATEYIIKSNTSFQDVVAALDKYLS